jgi:hypothetical protein
MGTKRTRWDAEEEEIRADVLAAASEVKNRYFEADHTTQTEGGIQSIRDVAECIPERSHVHRKPVRLWVRLPR